MRHSNPFAILALVSISAAACGDTIGSSSPATKTNSVSGPQVAPSALQNDSRTPVTILRDPNDGHLLRIHGDFVSAESKPEAAARAFLRRHAGLFELAADDASLALTLTRQGLAGTYYRFQQMDRGLPVFDAEVIVLVANLEGQQVVREINLAHRRALSVALPAQDIGSDNALQLARLHISSPVESAPPEVVRGIGGEPARVAYRVRISTDTPAHSWEILIDATTGAVISARDRIKHVTGTGMVFDPNPLASTLNYTFVDNADATNAALNAARYSVLLPNLDGSGILRWLWVDSHTKKANNPSAKCNEYVQLRSLAIGIRTNERLLSPRSRANVYSIPGHFECQCAAARNSQRRANGRQFVLRSAKIDHQLRQRRRGRCRGCGRRGARIWPCHSRQPSSQLWCGK